MGFLVLAVTACGCEMLPKFGTIWPGWDVDPAEVARFGPTTAQRIEALQQTARVARDMPAVQQQQLSDTLTRDYHSEQDPLVRLEIVKTLSELSTPSAFPTMMQSLNDPDPNIRIASCRLWAKRGGRDAVSLLSDRLSSDTNIDVRLAAARGLGQLSGPRVVESLGMALEDKDVALQNRAMQSLKKVTGRDLGKNAYAWRQLINRSGPLPSSESPSLANRLFRWWQ